MGDTEERTPESQNIKEGQHQETTSKQETVAILPEDRELGGNERREKSGKEHRREPWRSQEPSWEKEEKRRETGRQSD